MILQYCSVSRAIDGAVFKNCFFIQLLFIQKILGSKQQKHQDCCWSCNNFSLLQKLIKLSPELLKELFSKMMSLSNKIMFDISSRVSSMVLKNSSGAMVPYVSKTSISTTNNLELQHPSMPKKPLGIYFRFLGEIRPTVTSQNPGLKMTEVAKIMAQKYKGLPVDRKEVTRIFVSPAHIH